MKPSPLPPNTGDDLVIECLSVQCWKKGLNLTVKCPEWGAAGLYAIMFHTSHEGHPMRLTYKGVTLESPMTRQEHEKNKRLRGE